MTGPSPRSPLPLDDMNDFAKACLILTMLNIAEQYFRDRGRLTTPVELDRLIHIDSRLPRAESGLAIVVHHGQPLYLVSPWGSMIFPSPGSPLNTANFLDHFVSMRAPADNRPQQIGYPDEDFALAEFQGMQLPRMLWAERIVNSLEAGLIEDVLQEESNRLLRSSSWRQPRD